MGIEEQDKLVPTFSLIIMTKGSRSCKVRPGEICFLVTLVAYGSLSFLETKMHISLS